MRHLLDLRPDDRFGRHYYDSWFDHEMMLFGGDEKVKTLPGTRSPVMQCEALFRPLLERTSAHTISNKAVCLHDRGLGLQKTCIVWVFRFGKDLRTEHLLVHFISTAFSRIFRLCMKCRNQSLASSLQVLFLMIEQRD
jgi:hypothetical protein